MQQTMARIAKRRGFLTAAKISRRRHMLTLRKTGAGLKEIAALYGVSVPFVSMIVRGKRL